MPNERALLPEDRWRRSKSTCTANRHAWPRVQHHLATGATHANVATRGLDAPSALPVSREVRKLCCCERTICRWSGEDFAPPRTFLAPNAAHVSTLPRTAAALVFGLSAPMSYERLNCGQSGRSGIAMGKSAMDCPPDAQISTTANAQNHCP